MSPISPALIEKKLSLMVERITRLEKYAKGGFDKYRDQYERRKTTEKLLQELIETAIDVNTHILVESGEAPPDDYFSSFTRLEKAEWLSADLAKKLAPSAGLRNRLVHQYAEIDDRKIFAVLTEGVPLFAKYISSIRRRLKKK